MNFGRVISAMVTPFNDNLEVDYQQAVKLAKKIAQEGNDTILLAGTTGESPTLSIDEKLQLFEQVVRALKGSTPIMAGTGSNNTKFSIELSMEAEKIGVSGLLLVVPYYNRPTQNCLYEHFKSIAEAVSIPIILYNVPSRTVTNLEPTTVAKLAKIDNIIGVKEASGDMDQISQIKMLVPETFKIYSGDDSLTLPMLSLGCAGVISVASQLVGQEIQKMILLFNQGKIAEARKLHYKLLPVFDAMFITTNPIPVKAALNMTGFNVGNLRPPLMQLGEEEKQFVANAIKAFKEVNI